VRKRQTANSRPSLPPSSNSPSDKVVGDVEANSEPAAAASICSGAAAGAAAVADRGGRCGVQMVLRAHLLRQGGCRAHPGGQHARHGELRCSCKAEDKLAAFACVTRSGCMQPRGARTLASSPPSPLPPPSTHTPHPPQSRKFEAAGLSRDQAEKLCEHITSQVVLDRIRLSEKFVAKVDLEKVRGVGGGWARVGGDGVFEGVLVVRWLGSLPYQGAMVWCCHQLRLPR